MGFNDSHIIDLQLRCLVYSPTLLTIIGGDSKFPHFLRRLFLHEKRGLEVPNFVTFKNLLLFLVFHSVFG